MPQMSQKAVFLAFLRLVSGRVAQIFRSVSFCSLQPPRVFLPPAPFPPSTSLGRQMSQREPEKRHGGKTSSRTAKRPKKEHSPDRDTAQTQSPNDPTSAPAKPRNGLPLAPTQPPSGLSQAPVQSPNNPLASPAPADHPQAPGGQVGDSDLLASDGSDQEDDGDKWMRRAGETRWAQKVQKNKCLPRATRGHVKP